MKKLTTLLLAAAGLTLASCSQEDIAGPAVSGDYNYSFTVELPDNFSTRATNDGSAATNLYVGVYDSSVNSFVFSDNTKTFPNGQNTVQVNMKLVSGKDYTIAFFAYAPGAFSYATTAPATQTTVYSLEESTGLLTVDYSLMNQTGMNADTYDCFFKVYNTGTVGPDKYSPSVTLTRPIAQLNWGTDDVSTAITAESAFGTGLEYLNVSLSTNAYNTFNFLTGDIPTDAETTPITINGFDAPAGTAFPVQNGTITYTYVGMQYVLAPVETSATYQLKLNVNNNDNPNTDAVFQNYIEVASAPVQANYQTNIYGSLLTDNYNFNVTKSTGWATGSPYNVAVWDGTTTSEPTTNSNGAYVINTPGEWVWLTKNVTAVTGQPGRIKNDVVLNADLDFAGNSVQGVYYAGTFDGQGHTISNLTITPKSSYAAGFFGNDISVDTGATVTIQNVNFSNVTITNHSPSNYGWIGVVVGDIQTNNFVLDNVNVYNANLSGVQSVGGLVGFVSEGRTLTVTNCSVNNSTIGNIPVQNESGNVCGMVGKVAGTCTFETGNTINDVTINGFWTTKRQEASINEVAAIALNYNLGTINGIDNVKTNNVTLNAAEVSNQVKVNDSYYDTLDAALEAAPDNATITLGQGIFNLTTTTFENGYTWTFTGSGVDYTTIQYPLKYVTTTGYNLTFNNLTIQAWQATNTSMGFQEANSVTLNNCGLIGEFHAFQGTTTLTNCTSSQDPNFNPGKSRYGLWVESRTPESTTTVKDCTFTNFLAKGVLVYDNSSSATNLSTMGNITISNTSFTADAPYNTNAAIEIHTEYFKSAGTIYLTDVTYNSEYSGLWVQKNNVTGDPTHFYEIIVDGVVKEEGGQEAQ